MKDQLFILGPYFEGADNRKYYCGDSVAVEGLISFFPILRKQVEIHYIDAARPRQPIVDLIGEQNQSLPVLVIADASRIKDASIATEGACGRAFINSESEIRRYLCTQFEVAERG